MIEPKEKLIESPTQALVVEAKTVVVGLATFDKTTVALEVQAPFVIVHCKVTGEPIDTFCKVAVAKLTFEIFDVEKPEGLTTLQIPVPTEGSVADKLNVPLLHCDCAEPALAVKGKLLFKTTSSEEEQPPFVTVHRKVTELPTDKPEMADVGLDGEVMVAPFAKPIIDQTPVPTEGVVAAKVKEPLLHFDWSRPALTVVMGKLLVKTTSSKVVQASFVTVQRSVTEAPKATF